MIFMLIKILILFYFEINVDLVMWFILMELLEIIRDYYIDIFIDERKFLLRGESV